jgi:hypothetical protein
VRWGWPVRRERTGNGHATEVVREKGEAVDGEDGSDGRAVADHVQSVPCVLVQPRPVLAGHELSNGEQDTYLRTLERGGG